MNKDKNAYAIIDYYHEDILPVIAVCSTHKIAEKYISNKIKEDRQKGNNYSYDITKIACGCDMA